MSLSSTEKTTISNSNSPALTGSCYCGMTRYTSSSPPMGLTNCHCGSCRKLQGGAFVTFADIATSDLNWVDRTSLQEVRTSRFAIRGFCGRCSSMIFMRYDWEADRTGLCAGTVDDRKTTTDMDPLPKPTGHIFTELKASWFDITDGLPQYLRHRPEMQQKLDAWEARQQTNE